VGLTALAIAVEISSTDVDSYCGADDASNLLYEVIGGSKYKLVQSEHVSRVPWRGWRLYRAAVKAAKKSLLGLFWAWRQLGLALFAWLLQALFI